MIRSALPAFVLMLILASGFAISADPQDAAQPTIKTTTQEVLLDVVVRDGHGKKVKGLKASDFQVFENGVPRELKSFHFVQGRDVLQQQVNGATTKPTAAPANALEMVNLVCIVFQNLNPQTKKNAIDAVKELFGYRLTPGAYVAVFDMSGNFKVLQPFTKDRSELLEAANHAFAGRTFDFANSQNLTLNMTPDTVTIEPVNLGISGKGPGYSSAGIPSLTGGGLNTTVNTDSSVSDDAASNLQRGDLAGQFRQFSGIEGMRETDQILGLIQRLQTLPGRKSVILAGPGLATTGDADRFQAMLTRANRAGVTFYGLDVNGLTENSNTQAGDQAVAHVAQLSSQQAIASGAGDESASQNMERMRQGDYLTDSVRKTDIQASLRALSEGTGGFLIGGTNDYRKAFQRVLEDFDTHYVLGFLPVAGKMDGGFRSLKVKLGRSNLTTESRPGYYAMPPLRGSAELAPFEIAALAALNAPQPPHAFDFGAAAYHFRPSSSEAEGELLFEIPVASLAAIPEQQLRRHRMDAAIFALIKDASGQVVDKFSRNDPYEFPDDQLEAARNGKISFSEKISLPPGSYTVESVALDGETGRSSVSRLLLDVPKPSGVGLSSVALVRDVSKVRGRVDGANPFEFEAQPADGRRVTPEVLTHVSAGAKPYVYFTVYPDPAIGEKPTLEVEFRVGGHVVAQKTSDLPAADATGAIPMLISSTAQPGECELRITALQGSTKSTQAFAYTVASK